jgi:hypothetical protein
VKKDLVATVVDNHSSHEIIEKKFLLIRSLERRLQYHSNYCTPRNKLRNNQAYLVWN